MFQEAGKTVIVLGHHEDERVGVVYCGGKFWILDRLTRIVDREPQVADVDQLRPDVRTFRDVIKDECRGVFAQAALTRSAENDGSEDRACEVLRIHNRLVAGMSSRLQLRDRSYKFQASTSRGAPKVQ